MIFIRSCETIATADGWKYTIHTYYYLLVRKIKTNISAPIDFDVFISLPFCCCFFLDFSHFYTNNKNLKIEKKKKNQTDHFKHFNYTRVSVEFKLV